MDCPDVEQLEQFLDCGLNGNRGRGIRKHLDACAACRSLVDEVVENLRMVQPLQRLSACPGAGEAGGPARRPVFGNFRIVREIGRGGMGIVYEAEQLNPQRTVALKVLKGAPTDAYRVKLFRREARALARLKHPGIASICEAGCTPNGRHYLVMELVHGVPLNGYVRDGNLPDRDCLMLIGRIARAINYAHQCGVIHGDIKPSNILVDAEGHPKVLDFGLARIVEPDTAMSTILTDVGKLQGTLPYMSPEQLCGDAGQADLRTDVYALGVILYELLTGRLPHDVRRKAPHEIVPYLAEAVPKSPGAIKRSLRGDLETIMLKVLEKDPGRRYQNALAVAEDIDRYLANQPILARPASSLYQLRKLVTRHRLPFALAAAFLVLLTAFGGWMSTLYARAQRAEQLARIRLVAMGTARDRAQMEAETSRREAEKAARMAAFMQEILTAIHAEGRAHPNVPPQDMLADIAERAVHQLHDYPEAEAAIRTALGRAYTSLGLYDAAEHHLRRALDIRRGTCGDVSIEVASSHEDLANLYTSKDRPDLAVPSLSRALETRRALLGEEHDDVAATTAKLATALGSAGDPEAGSALALELLATRREQAVMADPPTAAALLAVSSKYYEEGDFSNAERLRNKALAIYRPLIEEYPRELIDCLVGLGWAKHGADDLAGAEATVREALEIAQEQLGPDGMTDLMARAALALLRVEQGDLKSADALSQEALAKCEALQVAATPALSYVLSRLSGVRWAKGDYDSAEALAREALAVTRQLNPEGDASMSGKLNCLAVILRDQEKYDEAGALFNEALERCRKAYGDGHRQVGSILNNAARLRFLQGDYVEAERLIREALEIRRAKLPPRHSEIAESMMVLGMVLTELGELESAESLLREAVDLRREIFSEGHRLVAEANSALSACLTHCGEYEEAERLLLASQAIVQRQLDPQHKLNRLSTRRLVDLYEAWGKAEAPTGDAKRKGSVTTSADPR